MKVRYLQLTGASGSMGGQTAARNRGGPYLRARVAPTNPRTKFQVTVRGFAASLTAAWRDELTPAQRAAWEAYADSITSTDVLGNNVRKTGLNFYIAGNSRRLLCGADRKDNAPVQLGQTFLGWDDGSWSLKDDGTFTIAGVSLSDWAQQAGGLFLVYVSQPTSPAINYTPQCRFAGFAERLIAPIDDPLVVTLNPDRLGVPLVAGQRRFVRFTAVDGQCRTTVLFNTGPLEVQSAS